MKKMDRNPKKPGLKMKELSEATGLAKSTLLYYVSLGLIPKPVKTSPNMAYYDPASINRVKFIQNMKVHHRLPLGEIRELMEQWDDDAAISTHVELTNLVFGPAIGEDRMDRNAFLEATGLTGGQVDELLLARLLIPVEEGFFDSDDVSMGRVLAQGLRWGYRISDLVFYVETGEQIVDRELALRKVLTRNLSVSQDAAMTLEMVKSARISRAYVTDRLFQRRIAEMKSLKDE